MLEKIKLHKDEVIVFMGSMNAMPMMYALELKKLGYEVIYFVDVKKRDILSRPENHFPTVFPRLFASLYKWRIRRLTKKNIGCFVLNGFFSSLSPYLPSSKKIGLSHGSDLDVWANTEDVETLTHSYGGRSIFKYLPKIFSSILIKFIVNKQYEGFRHTNAVVYFPSGFNDAGDKVVRQLVHSEVRYVPRYDISFEPLRNQPRTFKPATKILQIFSGVRFLYKTFPDGNKGYSKGNDLIIEGIAKYLTENPDIQVHFVEKGEDVHYAKELCRKLGLEQVIVWHKEMPFYDLLDLYLNSDICFDQLGEHWIGAIGGYALWLGKPLIANAELAVQSGVWPLENPVCSARTSDEVYEWLVRLEDTEFRRKISDSSKEFVEAYMGARKALTEIFELHLRGI